MSRMILLLTILPLMAMPFVSLSVKPATAMPSERDPNFLISLRRAENLARQAAETANGGLEHYRAEESMYGPAEQSPYVYDGHRTWTFTFKGHAPDSNIPTVESIVTVPETGLVYINYNGPIQGD